MPTSLPKFCPFKIISIPCLLAHIVSSIVYSHNILCVDSCNIFMYAANSVTPIKLYTQPKFVRKFLLSCVKLKLQSILSRTQKFLKCKSLRVCIYYTKLLCVESCHYYGSFMADRFQLFQLFWCQDSSIYV